MRYYCRDIHACTCNVRRMVEFRVMVLIYESIKYIEIMYVNEYCYCYFLSSHPGT